MFKCKKCKEKFEEPIIVTTTYEKYYGVSMEFDSYTPMQYEACPFCEYDEFYDIEGSYRENEKNDNKFKDDEDDFF